MVWNGEKLVKSLFSRIKAQSCVPFWGNLLFNLRWAQLYVSLVSYFFYASGSLLLAWQAPLEPFSRPPPMCWLPPASHYYQSDHELLIKLAKAQEHHDQTGTLTLIDLDRLQRTYWIEGTLRQSTLDWSTCPAFEDIPQNRWLSTIGQTKPLSGYSSRLILLNIIISSSSTYSSPSS